jgi:hypothetical protein
MQNESIYNLLNAPTILRVMFYANRACLGEKLLALMDYLDFQFLLGSVPGLEQPTSISLLDHNVNLVIQANG